MDLQRALLGTGLGKKEDLEKLEARQKTHTGQSVGRLKGKGNVSSMMNIDYASNITELKQIFKEAVKKDQSLIIEIIQKVHDHKDKEGAKRLIWILYSLRDNLAKTKPEFHAQIINRHLRRNGTNTKILPEWWK
ncbi:MAG: hypothetical protein PHH24_03595 [Candidatus Moranbacteria bacterium]|jgi:tRNA 2-selenouridine synthase SelU|nr:hypothetical protein [Candidatus Moranbacteria bacterium]MDD5652008.1 hypothetical protein [Candidatus Moranbacteria bacterium]MDX9855867.1 hypothetical protein [Candidatus Moranbacteria bacterium]